MKSNKLKKLFLISLLIAVTGAAMAYSSKIPGIFPHTPPAAASSHRIAGKGIIHFTGNLIQDKVLLGSAGTVGLNLTLRAAQIAASHTGESRKVDLVIVLDRSGSMKGRKINDARQAVLQLLNSLTARDRLALVTYSDDVQIAADLLNVTADNRQHLAAAVNSVRVGGGTNLGAGLQTGINILNAAIRSTNAAKVILISDGLANKGVTDIKALGSMAALAVENEFAISTVGVGAEFNEHLMTAIADQGTGSYYYLENPAAFAEVFQREFYDTQAAVVSSLKIQIPVQEGIIVADAAGYPLSRRNGYVVFYPGSLRSGQIRQLYLTLQVPTTSERDFVLSNITVNYRFENQTFETTLVEPLMIACVNDRGKVFSSIDKTSWTSKVINEDFNRLKQEVAADLKSGRKQQALDRIEQYHDEREAVNAVVGSQRIAENLDRDLKELSTFVEDTFQGAPAAVQEKQKGDLKG
ncbi:MAG: VWA domain-containing protein [Desulfobacterales bacterium]